MRVLRTSIAVGFRHECIGVLQSLQNLLSTYGSMEILQGRLSATGDFRKGTPVPRIRVNNSYRFITHLSGTGNTRVNTPGIHGLNPTEHRADFRQLYFPSFNGLSREVCQTRDPKGISSKVVMIFLLCFSCFFFDFFVEIVGRT